MAPPLSPLMTVMIRAAQAAAKSLLHDFGEVENLQVSRKGPADFVSTADFGAQKIIRRELQKVRPDFAFLMEEGGTPAACNPGQERFVIDPLDGTDNYLHGIPHWAISIAVEKDGDIIAALVFDPVKDEMYHAEKGAGAYMNNRRLRVSGRARTEECIIGTVIPTIKRSKFKPGFQTQMEKVSSHFGCINRMGSAALDLAYVASGRFDGFWAEDLKPWDIAAGLLIVHEAGGLSSRFDGKSPPLFSGEVISGNPSIHKSLQSILHNLATQPSAT